MKFGEPIEWSMWTSKCNECLWWPYSWTSLNFNWTSTISSFFSRFFFSNSYKTNTIRSNKFLTYVFPYDSRQIWINNLQLVANIMPNEVKSNYLFVVFFGILNWHRFGRSTFQRGMVSNKLIFLNHAPFHGWWKWARPQIWTPRSNTLFLLIESEIFSALEIE